MTHEERVQGLLEANNRLVELARAFKAQLRKNHALFSRYAAEHNKKADNFMTKYNLGSGLGGDPMSDTYKEQAEASRAKAVTNEVEALAIEVLLAQH